MESIKNAFVRFSFTLRKVMLCVVYTMILSCLPLNDAKAAAATVALAAPTAPLRWRNSVSCLPM